MLRLEDDWVWDSWVADDGERYHLFFLKAPRSLGDPSLRHARATVGHAVSTDLRDWEVLPDALGPRAGRLGRPGHLDRARWSAATTAGGGCSTPRSTPRARLRDQRIGVVESDDLITWQRVATARVLWAWTPGGTPSLPEDDTASETWRDPFVVRDEAGRRVADAGHGPRPRSAAGSTTASSRHAWSPDLVQWEVA